MTEKDLVTPNQQLKQSFQKFAAPPVDETSVRLRPFKNDCERLVQIPFLSAVSLDDAVTDPWMQATRYGRVDFVEVCCTCDSLLSGAVTSIGGRLPCNTVTRIPSISPQRLERTS